MNKEDLRTFSVGDDKLINSGERKRPLILLVEDEARLAKIILSKLEREGLPDVEWIRDAGALRAKFGGARPEVLVMHTSLPDAEPLALVEEIRTHPAWSEVPILILRDGFEIQSAEAFLKAGVQQVIQKPFQPSALTRAIRRLLDIPKRVNI